MVQLYFLKRYLFVFLLYFTTKTICAQFKFKNPNQKKETIRFELNHNLIIFPLQVNGKKLNFMLDSGVGATVLFNLNPLDSIPLRQLKSIKLKGLGSQEPINAILSRGNILNIANVVGLQQKFYIINDSKFDLSSKMGKTIHGIIGYEFLKNFPVEINYNKQKITIYNPRHYKEKKCRKCEVLDLRFHLLKPYVQVKVKLDESEKRTPVNLLIDSGGSDAIWLFVNTHANIKPPVKYFNDFLGEGLSGSIYGKRSRIKELNLGKFSFKNPTVSYPDSISIAHALRFKARNGSIGASVLKRFKITFNYPSKKLILKKASNLKKPFKYNMAGIDLAYNGKVLVKEREKLNIITIAAKSNISTSNSIQLDYNYKYVFKQSYRVSNVRENSAAKLVGVRKGDILIKINGKYTYGMDIKDIMGYFFEKEGKKIRLVIERNGIDYEYDFRLKDMLNKKGSLFK